MAWVAQRGAKQLGNCLAQGARALRAALAGARLRPASAGHIKR